VADKPLTFRNPINLSAGSERARRAGEPVVVLYKDDYYLFIIGGRGYWYSGNMRDWTRVNALTFQGGPMDAYFAWSIKPETGKHNAEGSDSKSDGVLAVVPDAGKANCNLHLPGKKPVEICLKPNRYKLPD
jgi:hypothetical protein